MKKSIVIPSHLTASQFGCDVDHFSKHVRGKELAVVNETRSFITLSDSTGEEWTVNKKDLNPHKTEEEIIDVNPELFAELEKL